MACHSLFHRLNLLRPRHGAAAAVLVGVSLAALAGCQRPVQPAANPFTIDAREYDRVYAAAAEVLRDHGFRVDRQDYRFGRVTSAPQGSPTIAEVWDPDNTTAYQAWQSTLADVQRTARVFLDPLAGEGEPAGDAEAYALRVEVVMEQRQVPVRRLTGSLGRNVFSSLAAVPAEWRERGIEASYWQPVGRDPHLEQRLLRDIVERATFTQ